ncbi:MAG: hypothetical protein ACYCUE_10660 [Steroidobacteraceae bacterium]|nr:hypothetical protein [Pseudomonadota bacterium]
MAQRSVGYQEVGEIETERVEDPQLTAQLHAAHVRHSGVAESVWLRALVREVRRRARARTGLEVR